MCVCVYPRFLCFLWTGRPDHPNRVVGQDTQVVQRMNSTALSVSRAGKTLPHMHTDRHTTHALPRLEIRQKREMGGGSIKHQKGRNLIGKERTERERFHLK